MNTEQTKFFNIVGRSFSLDEVVDEINDFVKKAPTREYKIIVGTDSSPREIVKFATAVTIWRVGNGGIHFWTSSAEKGYKNLRNRISRETMRSIILAQELRGRLKESLGDEFFWNDQIHIDVGENGPTRDLIDAMVGMVKGYGFDAVIKPYSFGASIVADRHT
ncbi:MAG: ribonuclease H-like YkuK family protein [Patescibacteria group bacterium]